ncbi:MAG TPA: hypothetical protein GX689_01020 [Lentisphaerae bacterium]|jgi:hypothetical protein|nr:hypothetical protein [Lentisphaerota bacterium]
MSAQTWDWVAVVAAVAFAIAWIGFQIRRNARKRKTAGDSIGACGTVCDGCPFAKGCGGKES